jgi:hypothetical protein
VASRERELDTQESSPWIFPLAVAVLIVLAAVPFIPTVAHTIKNAQLNDQVTVCGVIISAGGFALALWQLSRTKAATMAASDAITALASRLQLYENVRLYGDCLAISSEIDRYHLLILDSKSSRTLFFLPSLYKTLRLKLVELRKRGEYRGCGCRLPPARRDAPDS